MEEPEPEPEEVVEEEIICLNPLPEVHLEKEEEERNFDVGEIPEDLDPAIWERFQAKLRSYAKFDQRVKKMGETHQDMERHLFNIQSRAKAIGEEIQMLEDRARTVQEGRKRLALNTEVMVKTEQGKVEIEESPVVTDLKDCEMIKRRQVSEVNVEIRKSGAEKVEILKQTMGLNSQIKRLEWTKKKLSLEHKDAVDLTTELQLLRVTKSLQSLIKVGGHDNQKAAELNRLDRKIEFLNNSTREKTLGKKYKLMQYKKKIRSQTRENDRLLTTVQDLESAVRERVQISNIRDGDSNDDRRAANTRMKALVTRRKLVDLAKLQSEEIKFLRDQTERLRKRTFASFVVPQIPANPDEFRHADYPDHPRASSSFAYVRPKSRQLKSGMSMRSGDVDNRAVTR